MFRLQLVLGMLLALVLAGSAFAQSEGSGEFDSTGESGNTNNGSGDAAPAPTAKPKPEPTTAPAPVVTRAPVWTPPRVVPAPATSRAARKRAAAAAGCLSSRQKAVLQRRVDGQSVAAVARALDISTARVGAAERGALRGLISGRGHCARSNLSAAERKLSGAAQLLSATERAEVEPEPTASLKAGPAAGSSSRAGVDLKLSAPNKRDDHIVLMIVLLACAALAGVAWVELRKGWGLPIAPRFRLSRRE
jgi:DNA-binding CsgD family transcriptional regulator